MTSRYFFPRVGPFHCLTGKKKDNVSVRFHEQGIELKGYAELYLPWTEIITVKQYRGMKRVRIVVSKKITQFLPNFGNFGDGQKIYLDEMDDNFAIYLMEHRLVKFTKGTFKAVTYEVVDYQQAEKKANFWKRLSLSPSMSR